MIQPHLYTLKGPAGRIKESKETISRYYNRNGEGERPISRGCQEGPKSVAKLNYQIYDLSLDKLGYFSFFNLVTLVSTSWFNLRISRIILSTSIFSCRRRSVVMYLEHLPPFVLFRFLHFLSRMSSDPELQYQHWPWARHSCWVPYNNGVEAPLSCRKYVQVGLAHEGRHILVFWVIMDAGYPLTFLTFSYRMDYYVFSKEESGWQFKVQ